jgi:tetratricopeptide (TPR) repeat protein
MAMTTTPETSARPRVTGFILFTLALIALAGAGCSLLLPVYAHALSSVLLAEGEKASGNGDNDRALAELNQAIALNPQDAQAYEARTDVDAAKGNNARLIADCNQVILLDPKNALILNNLAWVLATCPDASLRDGKKAVEDATSSCQLTYWQYGASIDTLAAAYAEEGDFDNAVKWENQYLETPNLSASDAADGESRLALYQAHKPYHADQ